MLFCWSKQRVCYTDGIELRLCHVTLFICDCISMRLACREMRCCGLAGRVVGGGSSRPVMEQVTGTCVLASLCNWKSIERKDQCACAAGYPVTRQMAARLWDNERDTVSPHLVDLLSTLRPLRQLASHCTCFTRHD